MTPLVAAATQHFREFIATHCTKLQRVRVLRNGGLQFDISVFQVSLWVVREYFVLEWITHNDPMECFAKEIPISEPDSLEQVEKLLQWINNQAQ